MPEQPTLPDPMEAPSATALEERAPVWREGTVSVRKRVRPARPVRAAADDEERDVAEPDEDDAARAGRGADAAADAEEEVIEIAISSERAVERYDWWSDERFQEILGHGPGEIDLSYARDGLPFFVGHDSREMVGLIEGVRLDADRVLRGEVRFSKGIRAQEIRQDIVDGIRKKISVGYDYPEENYTENAEEGVVTRRYTGWRPLEASSVPIPADYDVGVGRSARPGARRHADRPGVQAPKAKEITVPEHVADGPAAGAGVARADVAADNKEIVAIARQHGMADRIADWVGNGASLAQVREEILKAHAKKFDETVTRGGQGDILDLSQKEVKAFSFARAIQNQLNGVRGYEHEVSDALYQKTGKKRTNPNSFMVPTQLLGRMGGAPMTRMEVATSGAGAQLKFTEYGGFLDLLRSRMYTGRLGITTLSGLQGDLAFVTQTSANTFQWGAETANPTATNFGTGLKTLAPKAGSAKTNYTRQLMAQSVESIEALVQDDLMKIVAIGLDKAVIQGSGSGSQPAGVTATTGIGSVTMGANGAVPTFPKLVDLWTEIAVDDADVAGMAYLTTPGIAGYLQQTQQFSGTNGVPIWTWRGEAGIGQVNGHAAYATSQVPSTLTKGTSTATCHGIIFGDWPTIVLGEWGAMELLVDPFSNGPAIINVSAYVLADVLLRYPQKMAAILDAKTS